MVRRCRARAVAAACLWAACTPFAALAQGAGNFTDLWWNPSESGWGINLNHQANTIFATWFSYSSANKASWYVMSDMARQADGSFTGAIYQTSGVPLAQIDGAAASRSVTAVGNATLRFPDA